MKIHGAGEKFRFIIQAWRRWVELWIGVAMAIGGVLLFAVSVAEYEWTSDTGLIDAGFVPGVCGLVLGLVGVAQAIAGFATARRNDVEANRPADMDGLRASPDTAGQFAWRPREETGVQRPGGNRVGSVAGMFIALVLFAALLPELGALAALLLLVFTLMLLQRQKFRTALVYTLVVVGSTWFLFDVVLRVPLPSTLL